MVEVGDPAPEIEAPLATPEHASPRGSYTAEDVERFSLRAALTDGPVVLAFFPGAFSRTCTQELCELRDWRAALTDLDAQVVGVSADTPWSLLAFIEEYDLGYPVVSTFNTDTLADYDAAVEEGGLAGIAARVVVVVGTDGTVAYRWDGGLQELPDLAAVEAALAEL